MKWALITGASSGLGRDFALLLATRGYALVLTARREGHLLKVREECLQAGSSEVQIFPGDLGDEAFRQECIQKARELKLEILINNAGFGDFGFFHESEWSRQQEMIRLNIEALSHLCHALIPHLLNQPCSYLLNIASVAAFQPGPGMSVYFASKAFVLHFSEALAEELSKTSLRVCCLCPGTTRTEFFDVAGMGHVLRASPSMDSLSVAKAGLDAMFGGRRVYVPGILNWILSLASRFFPRRFTVWLSGKILFRRM